MRLLAAHGAGGKEVTLALRSDGPLRNVALDESGAICDLRGILGNPGVRRCLFTGISLVDKRFLGRLTAGKIASTIPVFAQMIREVPGSVGGVVIDEGTWTDIGDRETYDRIRAAGPPLAYEKPGREPGAMNGHRPLPRATGSAGKGPSPPGTGAGLPARAGEGQPGRGTSGPSRGGEMPPAFPGPSSGAQGDGDMGRKIGVVAPAGPEGEGEPPGPSTVPGGKGADGGIAVAAGASAVPDGEREAPGAEAAALICRTFGLPADAEISSVPVGKGGSDRTYFRVRTGPVTAILMRYGRMYEENDVYAAVAAFLGKIGVTVP